MLQAVRAGASSMGVQKFGAAQAPRRVEDLRLLRGRGQYVDDLLPAGTLHGVVVRSPYAAARILGIDKGAALAVRGVRAVLTGADLQSDGLGSIGCTLPMKNTDGSPRHDPPRFALALNQVRHVGDPVAFVVAATVEAARDGAEAATVDYDPLPSITDPEAAIAPGAASVWPDAAANTCFEWGLGDQAATDTLFARAAHVTRLKV